MAILARKIEAPDFEGFRKEYLRLSDYLNSSRPTAVNLSCMLKRMAAVVEAHAASEREVLLKALDDEALAIHEEDIAMCRKISEFGLSLLKDGDSVITHCNAGPIATSRYGTARPVRPFQSRTSFTPKAEDLPPPTAKPVSIRDWSADEILPERRRITGDWDVEEPAPAPAPEPAEEKPATPKKRRHRGGRKHRKPQSKQQG
jgi:hypothetical protein